ncbi:MAG: hypothetical protein M8841_06240 [marine benthic group bacterium]|jgi:hypothetical protein|nr:hypothetical protein [Gemmatimonadota bacterium]MCL7982098.1 hypothetical protein [Gemmatimonadota bacterium]MCL7983893.1 hypothetical protein [Gemmatimonadota bacterium]
MSVNAWLVSFVVLLGIAGAWRFYRWRWRPRLEVQPEPRGRLRVRNTGSRSAKNCRATLLRLDRWEKGGWQRLGSGGEAVVLTWSDGSDRRDLAPGAGDEISTLRQDGTLPAGRYRVEVAVINGEEKRARFEVELGNERCEP